MNTASSKMRKTIETIERDLSGVRTGRASPALLEHIRIDYYGVPTPLNQLANVNAPDPRLLVIQPWDRASLATIEKSILKSDLGLNPVNDGNVLRLSIPPLSEERRKDLVKMVRKRIEEGKIAIRNVRRDAVEELKTLEKNKEISEDDQKRALTKLQKITDGFIEEADKLGKNKEKEVLEG